MRIGSVILTILFVLLIMVGCGSSKQQENVEETITVDSTEASTQPATEAAKEYYGVDLVNKSLSEIIEIMGGDFQTEYSGEHLIYYTSGGFCIFNNDTLPGFAFFISPADRYYDDLADPMTNLSGAKQDVLDGKYDSVDFIGVYGNAKYNEKISADMTYLEVSETIGSYKLAPVVGSAMPRQSIDQNATVWYDAGEMDEDTIKTANPRIKGISVHPSKSSENNETSTEAKVESTEAPKVSSQSDYSSYLGSWNYVFDNDGQLDENYAVVTSVTFNKINGTTADITIFKGNISKVCQIDITGEIVDGKIDFSYDKDGWLNSGHGTITLNGDSIHLYAEVDSYGENARMGLVCDDDLTK